MNLRHSRLILFVIIAASWLQFSTGSGIFIQVNASSFTMTVSKLSTTPLGFLLRSVLRTQLACKSKASIPGLILVPSPSTVSDRNRTYLLRDSDANIDLAILNVITLMGSSFNASDSDDNLGSETAPYTRCSAITWTEIPEATNLPQYKDSFVLEDCFSLNSAGWWYGGPELYRSHSASASFQGNSFPLQKFISTDVIAHPRGLGGILQPLWLTSQGWSVRAQPFVLTGNLTSRSRQALWASMNDNQSTSTYHIPSEGHLCLRSSWKGYVDASTRVLSRLPPLSLSYHLCGDDNVLKAWRHRVAPSFNVSKANFTNIDSSNVTFSTPFDSAVLRPIWSTWAEFKTNINQSSVLEYAKRIVNSGLPYSTLEIDDRWSNTYGELTFDANRFPDPEGMTQELHGLNFSVMIWVTPFCDPTGPIFEEGLLNRYWVMKSDASTGALSPYLVKWWQTAKNASALGSAVLDVTNPSARDWFVGRLMELSNTIGVDGFKLDAGEVIYIPPIADPLVSYFDPSLFLNGSQPLIYSHLWASLAPRSTAAQHSPAGLGDNSLSEIRSAVLNQAQGNFVRIMDLDSVWSRAGNGIRSALPRVLTLAALGYRYVLPDMIGGNGYGARGDLLFRGAPSAELYIRWLQMNALMPMQLSIPPWRYEADPDYDRLQRAVKWVFALRDAMLPVLQLALSQARSDPSSPVVYPLVRPLWMSDAAADEPLTWSGVAVEESYLVADLVVMAPVLRRNCTRREVVLPPGRWVSCPTAAYGSYALSTALQANANALRGSLGNFSALKQYSWSQPELLRVIGPLSFELTDIALDSSPPCFQKVYL